MAALPKCVEPREPPDLYEIVSEAHDVISPLPDDLSGADDNTPCTCDICRWNLDDIADDMGADLEDVYGAWNAHEKSEDEQNRCNGALARVQNGEVSALALAAEDADRKWGETMELIEITEGAMGERFRDFISGVRNLSHEAADALCPGLLKWCEYWGEAGKGGGWHFEHQVSELHEIVSSTSTVAAPKDGLSSVDLPSRTPIVYVLEEVGSTRDTPIVKIGTTIAGWKRVASFDPKYPYELRPVLALPGGRDVERQLHLRFKHLRLRGEWFRFVDDLRLFVVEQRAVHGQEQ